MDNKKNILIKEEETYEMFVDTRDMFLGDPLEVSWSTDSKNENYKLHFGWDQTENNISVVSLLETILESESECCPPPLLVTKELFVEEPLEAYWPTSFIKEDPELNLEAEETKNMVVSSTRYTSDNMRLIQNGGQNYDTLFEETVNQRVVHNDLVTAAEKSTRIAICCARTQGSTSQEDHYNPNLQEKDFHQFNCSVCLQSFRTKYSLIMHVFIHIDDVQPPNYVCKICGEVFPNNVSFNKHLRMSVGNVDVSVYYNDTLDCKDDHKNISMLGERNFSNWKQSVKQSSTMETMKNSNKTFSDTRKTQTVSQGAEKPERDDNYETVSINGNSNVHTVSLTAKKSYRCDICSRCFSHFITLKKHVLLHRRPHHCNICGMSFTELGSLNKHLFMHTGKKRLHKCDVCGKSLSTFGNLNKHMFIHSGNRPHKCDICGKSFTQFCHLKTHSIIHTDQKPHTCGICGKSYYHLHSLRLHSLVHTGERPYKCEICSKSFPVLSSLKGHVLTHTGIKRHKCNVCKKSFTFFGSLNSHAVLHTGKKPYKCSTCDKSFAQLNGLRSHTFIHTGRKPHKCDICGKCFSFSGNLKRHILIHEVTRKKPHRCNICGKSYAQASHLKRHEMTHSGMRPHQCDNCGKSFTESSSLKKHALIHEGKRPHKCDICSKSFTALGNLKVHLVTHTGKKLHKCYSRDK